MGYNVTVHGYRSTFRDWAAEATQYPNFVVEMALAHKVGDAVERAYRRGALIDRRRTLNEEWAAYCARPLPATGDVVPMRRGR
jgi:integrase